MSTATASIDLTKYRTERPDLAAFWDAVDLLCNEMRVRIVEPCRLGRQAKTVGHYAMGEAFALLVRDGVFSRAFVAKCPDGVITGEPRMSERDFPLKIPDRMYTHYYDIDDCEIIPVYVVDGELLGG